MEDIDLLADEFVTSNQKVEAVIRGYGLFKLNDQECFFSPKLIEFLMPYLNQKQSRRVDGIKGNLIRHGHYTKQQLRGLSDEQILQLNDKIKHSTSLTYSGGESHGESGGENNSVKLSEITQNQALNSVQSGGESQGESGGGRYKSKVKESKVKEKRESTHAREDFSRINETPVPEDFQSKEFQAYENFMDYMLTDKGVDVTPLKTSLHLGELVRLKNAGNDPVKVINQTIMSDNKSFYPLRDKQFGEQDEEGSFDADKARKYYEAVAE